MNSKMWYFKPPMNFQSNVPVILILISYSAYLWKHEKKMKEKKTLEFFLIYYAMPYQHKAYSFIAVLSDETESCLQLSLFPQLSALGILFNFIFKNVKLSLMIFQFLTCFCQLQPQISS